MCAWQAVSFGISSVLFPDEKEPKVWRIMLLPVQSSYYTDSGNALWANCSLTQYHRCYTIKQTCILKREACEPLENQQKTKSQYMSYQIQRSNLTKMLWNEHEFFICGVGGEVIPVSYGISTGKSLLPLPFPFESPSILPLLSFLSPSSLPSLSFLSPAFLLSFPLF